MNEEMLKEKDLWKFKLKITLPLCVLGKQLSTFLIEHGYAAEKINLMPTEQEIGKLASLISDQSAVEVSNMWGKTEETY